MATAGYDMCHEIPEVHEIPQKLQPTERDDFIAYDHALAWVIREVNLELLPEKVDAPKNMT